MDRAEAEDGLLKNFDDQLERLQSLLSPTTTSYDANSVNQPVAMIQSLFREGARAILVRRGAGSAEWLERLVESIAQANKDSIQPLIDFRTLVSEVRQSDRVVTSIQRFAPPRPTSERTVFIVHGRRLRLVKSIRSALSAVNGLEIKVLNREVNKGRTLIEKFDDTAGRAAFAVVVATADDKGMAAETRRQGRRPRTEKRARQNVIFEWGYFIGRLGRDGVALLYEEGVVLPSDVRGIVHISLDLKGKWKVDLVREVRARLFDR